MVLLLLVNLVHLGKYDLESRSEGGFGLEVWIMDQVRGADFYLL